MKKIVKYIVMTSLAVLALSCQKNSGESGQVEPGMKGVFYADIPGEKSVVEIAPGATKTYALKACSFQGKVTDITMNFSFKSDPDAVAKYNESNDTDYQMCPGSAFEFLSNEVMLPRYGKASTTAKIKVNSSGLEQGITYILPVTLDKAKQTESWELADTLAAYVLLKASNYDPYAPGTENNPYPISTVEDFKSMDSKLGDLMVYFKLENDLDLSGEAAWKSLNAAPYRQFSLDGDGHTISGLNASACLFEVAIGRIVNLKIENFKIAVADAVPAGLIASYGGMDDMPLTVKNVSVQGSVTNGKAHGTGGLFGIIAETTIDACSADVIVTSNGKYDVGGIYGYDNSQPGKKSVISNCWTSGDISGNRMVGGIAGMLSYKENECAIINCYSTAAVHAQFQYGGIVGNAIKGDKSGNATAQINNHIERCIAWNQAIYSDVADEGVHYSAGAIVGFTALKNYHIDCYRRPDLDFRECPGNTTNVLIDQENSSPESPLVEKAVSPGSSNYNFPYHGKAAAQGATASQVAKNLKWDENIWDLSGALPFFRGGDAPVIVEDDNAGGQLPDFDEHDFFNE